MPSAAAWQLFDRISEMVQNSDYDIDVQEVLLDVLHAVIRLSMALFPHSHLLRESKKREAQILASFLRQDIQVVLKYIGLRLGAVEEAAYYMAGRENEGTVTMSAWERVMTWVWRSSERRIHR